MAAKVATPGTQLRKPESLVGDRILRFVHEASGFVVDHGDGNSVAQATSYRRCADELARGKRDSMLFSINDTLYMICRVLASQHTFIVRPHRQPIGHGVDLQLTGQLMELISELIASNFDPED